jgi:dipeptidase E
MRLFISSYRAGKHDQDLIKFLGKINKMAVITNAKDYKTPEDRRLKIEEHFSYYRSLGLEPTEIDLREYFHKSGVEKVFLKQNFIWLAGGNTFLLRKAIRQSGLEPFLSDWVRKNEIILAGESAGAVILGPTLRGAEDEWSDEDSPYFKAEGYQDEIIWEGLDFVTFVPV